jgi:hypothetical protein
VHLEKMVGDIQWVLVGGPNGHGAILDVFEDFDEALDALWEQYTKIRGGLDMDGAFDNYIFKTEVGFYSDETFTCIQMYKKGVDKRGDECWEKEPLISFSEKTEKE